MAYILSKTPILYRAAYYKNIITGPFAKVTCAKNYGYFSPVKSDTLIEKRFRLKDNIADDYKLIYREHNAVRVLITCSYYTGWISLLAGVIIVGYLLIENPPLDSKEVEDLFGIIKFENELSRLLVASSGIILPIIFIRCIRIIPFRIYYSSLQKLYKVIFVPNILYRKKNIETFGEGCAVSIFNRFNFLADTFFKINGRIVMLDRDYFTVQAIREKMIYRTK
ncbi:uncharacterized protein LOC116845829 [Odontomachus brunneus]|uniref:uncharacterized protein LOC116845829 n=1 Tax=Odontomachus brunneus TaxID=486640 RepID=UPI0013F19FA0|nr:uncharacterized protein LOC116845829 [Odontomachus brunneus]